MTHTTTTTAMRISKPTTGLIHSSTLIKLVLVINFFTLLRAAWLLHPSQSTKPSCDLTDFSSTPITSTSSLTMAPAQSKDTNSTLRPCSDSRHSKNHILAKPKPKGYTILAGRGVVGRCCEKGARAGADARGHDGDAGRGGAAAGLAC